MLQYMEEDMEANVFEIKTISVENRDKDWLSSSLKNYNVTMLLHKIIFHFRLHFVLLGLNCIFVKLCLK